MNRCRYRPVVALILAGMLGDSVAPEDDNLSPDPASVIAMYNARDDGEHVRRIVTITQRTRRGREHAQTALSCRKYYGLERRTVFFFLSPSADRGKGFLTIDYEDGGKEDDQWLYLPSARKARRINAGDRRERFVGTDFTYEDIKKETRINTEEFSFDLLGAEILDGHMCLKIEATPTDRRTAADLGYERAIHWLNTEILLVLKSQFFNSEGEVLRTIRMSDIERIGGIWTAQRITAATERTGHSTELRFTDIDYEARVDDLMFTPQALIRGPGRH